MADSRIYARFDVIYLISVSFSNIFFRPHFIPIRPDEFRSKVACENEVIQLVCNPFSRIAIYSASYGRTEYESIQCAQPQGVKEESKFAIGYGSRRTGERELFLGKEMSFWWGQNSNIRQKKKRQWKSTSELQMIVHDFRVNLFGFRPQN